MDTTEPHIFAEIGNSMQPGTAGNVVDSVKPCVSGDGADSMEPGTAGNVVNIIEPHALDDADSRQKKATVFETRSLLLEICE